MNLSFLLCARREREIWLSMKILALKIIIIKLLGS